MNPLATGSAAPPSAWISASINDVLLDLLDNPDSTDAIRLLLNRVNIVFRFAESTLLVANPARKIPAVIATTASLTGESATQAPTSRALIELWQHAGQQPTDAVTVTHKGLRGLRIVRDDALQGLLIYRLAAGNPEPDAAELRQTLRGITKVLLGIAISKRSRRVELYEERAAISRELHDSLAQSLTYLKIQSARMQSILAGCRNAGDSSLVDAENVLHELRTNLQTAYQQLRELMTSFRLTIQRKSFHAALLESVREFKTRCSIAFELDNRFDTDLLSVDEEMQLLRIVREAMANIVRHSHARRATIRLDSDRHIARIHVEDDGIGIEGAARRERHHGLVIMQERAHNLGGALRTRSNNNGGTTIEVEFTPKSLTSEPGIG